MAAACAFAIISGKNIFNRAMPERLRTLRHCIFTRRGRKGKRQLPELPQSKPDGFASSLEEGASGAPANFALEPETVPLCQRPHLRGRLPPAGGRCRAATKRGICRAQRDWGSLLPARPRAAAFSGVENCMFPRLFHTEKRQRPSVENL